jgi:hypothetical protein
MVIMRVDIYVCGVIKSYSIHSIKGVMGALFELVSGDFGLLAVSQDQLVLARVRAVHYLLDV